MLYFSGCFARIEESTPPLPQTSLPQTPFPKPWGTRTLNHHHHHHHGLQSQRLWTSNPLDALAAPHLDTIALADSTAEECPRDPLGILSGCSEVLRCCRVSHWYPGGFLAFAAPGGSVIGL